MNLSAMLKREIELPKLSVGFTIFSILLACFAAVVIATAPCAHFNHILTAAALAAIAVLSGIFAFKVSPNLYVSLYTSVFVAGMFMLPAPAAVLVPLVASVVLELGFRRRGFPYLLRNAGMYFIMIAAGSAVYTSLGGGVPPSGLPALGMMAALMAFATYWVINELVMLASHILRGRDYREFIRGVQPSLKVEAAMFPFALVFALSFAHAGGLAFIPVAILLVVGSYATKKLVESGEKLGTRVAELSTLNTVGQAMGTTLKLNELLELIYEQCKEIMDVSNFFITLYDKETDQVDFRIYVEDGKRLPPWKTDLSTGMTKWIMENNSPLLMGYVEKEQADYGIEAELTEREKETGEMSRSWLGVPLKVGDRTVGVMSVQHDRENVYHEPHLQVFETLASYAANAVENARLYEGLVRTKEQIEQWNRLLEQKVEERSNELRRERDKILHFCAVTYSIEKADSLDGKLETLASGVAKSGWSSVFVSVFDEDMEKKLELVEGAAAGLGYLETEGMLNRKSRPMLFAKRPDTETMGECIVLSINTAAQKGLVHEEDVGLAKAGGADVEQLFLYAPMRGRGGSVIGVVAATGLGDGAAPSIESARILELYANHGAAVVERFEMERELHKHSLELENLVKERTRELEEAQERLVQSGKMVAVGQLAAGIAHELNNPLTGILGYSQLLVRETREDVRTRGLERMREEATRCSKIIENLLSFSRQYRPSKRYESINGIIARVMRLREYQLKVNGIEIEKQIQSELPNTMVDPHQLEQVFMNIINNAEQALQGWSGEKKISLTTERADDSIRVIISDSGPGINGEDLNKVFDPFFTTRGVGEGAGLGLSISYGIVDRHGGRLYTLDTPGATFVVEIPITGSEETADIVRVNASERPASRQARVLIVDDEESILNLVSDVVMTCGHVPDTARDGKEAFRLLLLEDYDLIISDLKMPGVDGKGLYKRLEKSKPHLLSKLIFATGDIVSTATREFLDQTGVRCINKPFDIEEIERLISLHVS